MRHCCRSFCRFERGGDLCERERPVGSCGRCLSHHLSDICVCARYLDRESNAGVSAYMRQGAGGVGGVGGDVVPEPACFVLAPVVVAAAIHRTAGLSVRRRHFYRYFRGVVAHFTRSIARAVIACRSVVVLVACGEVLPRNTGRDCCIVGSLVHLRRLRRKGLIRCIHLSSSVGHDCV